MSTGSLLTGANAAHKRFAGDKCYLNYLLEVYIFYILIDEATWMSGETFQEGRFLCPDAGTQLEKRKKKHTLKLVLTNLRWWFSYLDHRLVTFETEHTHHVN